MRRSLEVRAWWRWLFGGTLAVVGAVAIASGGLVPIAIGAACGAAALAVVALPRFAPEHAHRKLLVAAGERIERDGDVTLAGIAEELGDSVVAPYSRVPCLAYWARQVSADPEDDRRDAGLDTEQRAAASDFALVIGDARIRVPGRHAELVFDRARARVIAHGGTRARREEIVLRAGERVVVRGVLARQNDSPFRTTAELGGRVTIALGVV